MLLCITYALLQILNLTEITDNMIRCQTDHINLYQTLTASGVARLCERGITFIT